MEGGGWRMAGVSGQLAVGSLQLAVVGGELFVVSGQWSVVRSALPVVGGGLLVVRKTVNGRRQSGGSWRNSKFRRYGRAFSGFPQESFRNSLAIGLGLVKVGSGLQVLERL